MNLTMSLKERDRLVAMRALDEGKITVGRCAQLLGLSCRQVRRVFERYRSQGDVGLIHRSRGRSSNRCISQAVKERAVALLRRHYHDFGATLAAEKLREAHEIAVSKETVRQWMIEEKLHTPKPRKLVHRSQRERRECFGELLQIDGSPHAWFEGRGDFEPDLIGSIDDATGRVWLQFAPAESTEAVMRLLRDYIGLWGRPVAVYADRHSIYQTTRDASVDEQLRGREAETQMGRALRELGIEYIAARSPQAKGRVERLFGTLQDRLVKELRLAGISDIDSANRFLNEHFIDDFNSRFAVQPRSSHDAHRPAEGFDLDAILSHQQTRVVTNDYTIRYHNIRYQIAAESVVTGLRGGKVTVEQRLDGSIQVRFRERYLSVTELPPAAAKTTERKADQPVRKSAPNKPAADHPWRQGYSGMKDGPIHP